MEWIIRRLCEDGRPLRNRHLMIAREVRACILVSDEHDDVRHRTVRVARASGGKEAHDVPPLFDVQLVASKGAAWTLSGYERVIGGPLQEVRFVGQSWLLTPAQDEDLLKLEGEVSRLARLLHRHGIDPREGNSIGAG